MELKAYFLVGPTACGKSEVAEYLADLRGYSLVSADSMQVYKDLDIGTDKPSKANLNRYTYYCIDLVKPSECFSVAEYYREAIKAIKMENERNRDVIVVGGSGLYINSLIYGIAALPGVDSERKRWWEEALRNYGISYVLEKLKDINRNIWEEIKDKKNPRRVLRAILLAEAGIKNLPDNWKKASKVTLTGLRREKEDLVERIKKRVDDMFKRGLIEETENVLKKYGKISATALQAIGYKEAMEVLRGYCSVGEAKEKIIRNTFKLVKKQMTWFRHQCNVVWIDVKKDDKVEDIAFKVESVWQRIGACKLEILF